MTQQSRIDWLARMERDLEQHKRDIAANGECIARAIRNLEEVRCD